jgi:hypothetical protein
VIGHVYPLAVQVNCTGVLGVFGEVAGLAVIDPQIGTSTRTHAGSYCRHGVVASHRGGGGGGGVRSHVDGSVSLLAQT